MCRNPRCSQVMFSLIPLIILLQMIPVAANDVAFSIHAVLLTAFTLFQIAIYDVSGPFQIKFCMVTELEMR